LFNVLYTTETLETNTDGDVLLILDVEDSEDLRLEGLSREVINRFQHLRKKAGLTPTDDVKMEYKVLTEPEQVDIERAFVVHASAMSKAFRGPIQQYENEASINGSSDELIPEEQQTIQEATFLPRICKL
jgi:isoleucyl-tRNA synthetase